MFDTPVEKNPKRLVEELIKKKSHNFLMLMQLIVYAMSHTRLEIIFATLMASQFQTNPRNVY